MNAIGIIPARYESTRFPGKPLVDIDGKSMIARVCEQASACAGLSNVIVATDDDRIRAHVEALGYAVQMTWSDHKSGTDRCAEVASSLEADVVVNIQGDEPFTEVEHVRLLASLLEDSQVLMGTLASPIAYAGGEQRD